MKNFLNNKYKVNFVIFCICMVLFTVCVISKISILRHQLQAAELNLNETEATYEAELRQKDTLINIYKEKYETLLKMTQEDNDAITKPVTLTCGIVVKPTSIADGPAEEYEEPIPTEIILESDRDSRYEEEIIPVESDPIVEPIAVYDDGSHIPGDTGFRSYEPYTAIGYGSVQWQLLQYATPNEDGLMTINGRPLVAIGTGWGYWIGDEITVYTDLGSYDCIVGDIKDDAHTNWTNKVTYANGCACEFIVDLWGMDDYVRCSGTISSIPKYSGLILAIVKTGEVGLV